MANPRLKDEIAVGAIGTIIAFTWVWFIFFYCKSTTKPKRVARKPKSTFKREQKTINSRSMQQRVDMLLSSAQDIYDEYLSEALSQNAATAVLQPYREGSCFTFRVLAMTISDQFDGLLKRKAQGEDISEPLKKLGLAVSFAEGTLNELWDTMDDVDGEEELQGAVQDLQELGGRLVNLAEDLGTPERVDWQAETEAFKALERKIKSRVGFTKQASALPPEEEEEDKPSRPVHDFFARIYSLFFRQHPIFYGIFWSVFFGILGSHLAFIGEGELRPGTFLSLPPQYDLKGSQLQAYMLPFVFGFMHCALYLFGLIPVCFTRGLHRDLLKVFGALRIHIPFDDMFFFHQMIGFMLIGCLFIASNVWFTMMATVCISHPNDVVAFKACTAFNPIVKDAKRGDSNGEILFDSLPGASYFDPRDNVIFLREIVWTVWFFVMPLLYWRARPNPRLPPFVKRWWWEIVYYLHLFGAVASILLALYARFEVFYPMLIGGWSLWFFDKIREATFKTYDTTLTIDAQRPSDSSYNITAASGQPTVLACQFAKPKHMDHGKGQWLYLQVPEVDWVWHPFSLSSSTEEPTVQLLLGIQGKWEVTKEGEWIQPPSSETWTYRLLKAFRRNAAESLKTRQPQHIKVRLRGPYGSPFQKCFDHQRYPAVIIIGAGTGLTSALSVLKEMVSLRRQGRSKQFVWFVWSCRRVSDLLMCWRALHELLFQASRDGTIHMDEEWNPMTSVMFDWLSITVYVTKADKDQLMMFLDNTTALAPTKGFSLSANNPLGKKASSPFRDMLDRLKQAGNHKPGEAAAVAFTSTLASLKVPKTGFAGLIAKATAAPAGDDIKEEGEGDKAPAAEEAFGFEGEGDKKKAEGEADGKPVNELPLPPRTNRFASMFGKSPLNKSRRSTPQYLAPPPFDQASDAASSTGGDVEAPASGGASKLKGLGRWKAACMRATVYNNILEKASSSLDNEQLGKAGDFLIREGPDGSKILVILDDPESNQFEFHQLAMGPEGSFTLDGKNFGSPKKTIEAVIAHLKSEAEHITTKLRKITDPASRAYMNKAIDKLLVVAREELLKLDVIPLMTTPTAAELNHNPTKDISTWMKEQVLATSMDNKGANISRLFQWVREFCSDPNNGIPNGKTCPVAISFCGPPVLAHLLGEASASMGGSVEYSSEHI